MMDIQCRFCGEPWEHDTLHDVEGMSYDEAGKAFAKYGCNALLYPPKLEQCSHAPCVEDDELQAIHALMEVSDYPEEWIGASDLLDMMRHMSKKPTPLRDRLKERNKL